LLQLRIQIQENKIMSGLLREQDWEVLISRIKLGKCTPFLGAGACYGVLPLGGEIAKMWAEQYGYPLDDPSNLISVSQYLAVKRDSMFPKFKIVEMFEGSPSPNFKDPLEPHSMLASLPLPIYITTNYDDFMTQALKRHYKEPKRVLCCWNRLVKNLVRDDPSFVQLNQNNSPNVANPAVFHLHGYVPVAESLVLTEDDYMDFLVNVASDNEVIPPQIARALTGTTLLFIGYRIADWNFRVLLRSFERFMERTVSFLNVAVMLPPAASESTREEAQAYLTSYYANIDVRVYWGSVKDFMEELKKRWDSNGS
jgi:SIR2-like domain